MSLMTLAVVVLLAQIGYPGGYPPGQYPGRYPGGYPGGGGGIPIPGRSKKTTTSEKQQAEAPTTYITGVVKELSDKSVVVEASDTRIITIQLTDKTTKPKDLGVRDTVEVAAKEDGNGGFIADSVKVTEKSKGEPTLATATGAAGSDQASPAAERESDATTAAPKGPKFDQGDSGPPVLKRGRPVARKESDDDNDTVLITPERPPGAPPAQPIRVPRDQVERPPASLDPRQAFIEQAREAADNFLTGLPNYVCQENTTRYESQGKEWNAIDVVSMELVYEGGKESYRNIQINGRPTKKPIEDTGAWSTGEFGTVLADIFSPATAAKFTYMRDSSSQGIPASVYDFVVDRQHSHWHVQIAAQSIFPSYKGTIWLDKKTARTLRIEMQATHIPPEFPEDAVESAVDYGYVSLAATEKFFLPLHAEVLSCHRGSSVCDKNAIDFRNYHKFTGESTIIFNDK